ncbi:MAG: Peptidyl-tRNA hydrolase [Candidatus Shapirobacteria bacterium GW2011_GWE1_38_10]|uniref:Peptidyl-tRNA hydrolase n=1 Tax=Candidatus Shapirobacteria bacterium GW2011_GWE1_38_10 TaxID=1618488 RepID=A0A0G0IHI8_9BACT|nr:MAG: Peptidyl-tRNA hydrolase [Candidatus Shapirobacteria bacterium GW2011_GWF2_37_20]KKQ50485.1 MAG: Peptidyl-tRNA hydrolase [Candidatus Shapirobacteria bacterium GW2011_GWE1_38_10]KKQ65142.1 MAG: Peptidyl-tRNA hydrolase [Candidatus Shapirobacteria bacterium GW2011_GWF1_38_23]HBP50933.1 aminoacyl-tRNA hydrolase [Candidatus Shapirobacteria bacterium]
MKLFFGLGNPGKEHENTRHNLGQILIHKLSEKYNFSLSQKNKLLAQVGESSKNIFAISTEYMNLSGISVQKIAAYYKIPPKNIYLIHDDLDLPVGKWRLQFDRGPAGHNGVLSTIENLCTQAFWRIRVGIGKSDIIPTETYVLKPFSADEKKTINTVIDTILSEIEKLGH